MKTILASLDKALTVFTNVFLGVAMIALTLIVNIQVVARYFLKVSIGGLEELPVILMIISVWLAAAYVAKTDNHVKIEFLDMAFKNLRVLAGVKAFLKLVTFVVLAAFCVISFKYAVTTIEMGDSTAGLHIPLGLLQGVIPLSTGLMVIHYGTQLAKDIKAVNRMALVVATSAILALIFLGMSVPFCFLSGSLLFAFIEGGSVGKFVSSAYYALDSFSTLAIPLFMIAGTLIEHSGIARTLIDLAEVMLKKVKGGMGATIPVVACFFGALSGSGTATVTTLSSMMTPRLKELGWDKRYIAAFIAAAGPLGYMIPPNMNAIIYTTVSTASVAALFLATVIPGLMWAGLYLVINRLVYTKWYHPVVETGAPVYIVNEDGSRSIQKSKTTAQIVWAAVPAFLMPVIIMGGIYGGIFTPTEAGGIGCLYALIVGMFVYKKIRLRDAFKSFLGTGTALGSILIIFPMTLIFSRILVVNGVPELVTQFISSISTNRYVILLIIDIILFIAGFFLDAGILLLVFTPLLLPTAMMVGISQVQLGVIMFVAVGVGTITPPMAMNLFITGKICDVSVKDMMSPLWPLLLFGALPVLILVTFVPELSIWLPKLVMGAVYLSIIEETPLADDFLTKTKKVRCEAQKSVWKIRADICVVGAGISGLSAALEATRAGKKVVLMDGQQQIGGQTYNGCIGCFCGFYSNGKNGYQFTHGIADDLFRDLTASGGLYETPTKTTRVPYYNETLFLRWAEKKVLAAGIQVLLGATVRKVNKSGRRLTSIEAVTRYGEVLVEADAYVDASGDAVVAWLAGLACNVPEEGSVYGTEMFLLEGIDYSKPVPSEEALMERMSARGDKYKLVRKKGLMFYTPQRGGCGIAFGNMTHVDTPLDPIEASLITLTGKDQVDTVVDFLRKEYPENFARSNVRQYGQTGIRQTRWISGVKQLSLADVRSGTRFDDAIARASWPVELHNHGDGYVWEVFGEDHVHYIPLGSLLSPEADNYAACGRCIDADVAALSSVRVMGPCVATGTAAAHAVAMAGKGSVHDIDIKVLQKLLSDNLDRRD